MSYKFERFAEREAQRDADLQRMEAEEIERARLASRSLWEQIMDLSESNELKEVLWALMPKDDEL